MPVPRSVLLLIPAVLLAATTAVAAPPADDSSTPAKPKAGDTSPSAPATSTPPATPPAAPSAAPPPSGVTQALPGTPANQEEFKREVMEEVRRELDKAKSDIKEEQKFVDSAADAANYDAEQLKQLKETVNLLQMHGYLRVRGDLFNHADLGTGPDQTGHTLFPVGQGQNLGVADMRLRLNPVLRISDRIAIYSQFDILDNAVLGGNPLANPFFDVASTSPVGEPILSSRVAGQPISVKRVWGEIETPIGQFAAGRMPFHFGEGMVYNDGNCLDCDYGTTFDRGQFTFGPQFGGHLATIAADYLTEGTLSNNPYYGQQIPTQQLATGYRFSLEIIRVAPPLEIKRRLDNNEWVLQYGLLGAYRNNPWQTLSTLQKIGANFGEGDVYFQAMHQKLKLSGEGAFFGGQFQDRIQNGVAVLGQPINFLQGAAVLRGQYAFLKQDALLLGLDVGFASGDKSPGIGVQQSRPGSSPNGSTQSGNIDGPKYNCTAASCPNNDVTNFVMNPDFRIDQLLWRNLYTAISGAMFARLEGRYKLGGRASGGGEDEGFEFAAAVVYSQAIYASSTPSGTSPLLGVEIDPAISYTTHDHFFASVIGGFLIPLAGLTEQGTAPATFGYLFRGVVGVSF